MFHISTEQGFGPSSQASAGCAGTTFDNDLLICRATGDVDTAEIARQSVARAKARYGVDCRPSDIAYETEKLTGIAQILRNRRRAELGLSDDTVYVTVMPFGRQVEGVRRSAF